MRRKDSKFILLFFLGAGQNFHDLKNNLVRFLGTEEVNIETTLSVSQESLVCDNDADGDSEKVSSFFLFLNIYCK